MDYINHIYEFVDGTIDPLKEQQLFNELSINEELRSELKEQISVSNAIKNDFIAFNPSADSTLKIFSQLGMTSAVATSSNILGNSLIKNKLLGLFSNYSQAIYTLIGTSVLATIGYFMLEFNGNSINLIQNGNNQPTYNSSSNNSSNNIPNSYSFNNDNKNDENLSKNLSKNDTTFKTEIIYKDRIIYKEDASKVKNLTSVYKSRINQLNQKIKDLENNLTQNSNSSSDNLNTENTNLNLAEIIEKTKIETKIEVEKQYETFYHTIYLSKETPNIVENIVFKNEFITTKSTDILVPMENIQRNYERYNESYFDKSEQIGISLETSWAQYFSTVEEKINPAQYQNFNNFRVAALYNFNNEISAGLDFRRENFYQVYNLIDKIGDPYIYEQKPNFNTLSAVVRYKPNFLKFYNFDPFAQFGIGGNVAGEVGRIMIGSEYKIANNYKFLMAFDYNMLNFHHNQIRYTSNKYGFHMGIGIDI